MPNFKDINNKIYWLDEEDDPAVWLPEGVIEITDQEAADIARQNDQSRLASSPYVERRLAEYPPITDYIDGVVKGDQAQINAYINKCLEVKAKYPKQ